MRKPAALIAVAGLLAVALTGCSPVIGTVTCERPVQNESLSSLIQVAGDLGEELQVSGLTPIRTSTLEIADFIRGEGPAVVHGEQLMFVEISFFSGETGKFLRGTDFGDDTSYLSTMDSWSRYAANIGAPLSCATEGSRVVAVLGPQQLEDFGSRGLFLEPTESVIAVYDVQRVHLPRAQGTPVLSTTAGLPTVVLAPDGHPGIVIPDTEPPSEVASELLIRGSGATVAADSVVIAHYAALNWATGATIRNTWEEVATPIDLATFMPSVSQSLAGKQVGSQVLVVVPPEFGFGDESYPNAPAGSTLVFVIDILGIQ